MEETLGVGPGVDEHERELREARRREEDRRCALLQAVEHGRQQAQVVGSEELHLVEQEHDTRPLLEGGRSYFHEELDDVVLAVSGIGYAGHRLDIDVQPPGPALVDRPLKRLQHPKRALHGIRRSSAAAQPSQRAVREQSEHAAHVVVLVALDDPGRDPTLALRDRVELREQDGLADAAQPREDEAASVIAVVQPLDRDAEGLEVAVSRGEVRRADAGAGRVRIVRRVHASTAVSNEF